MASIVSSNLYNRDHSSFEFPNSDATSKIFNSQSTTHFPFHHLKEGDSVLFAGCGNGQLVVEIARTLNNPRIRIVAFDIIESQLAKARSYAEQEKVDGIEWVLQDARNLSLMNEKFTIVHTRFLLNHLYDAELVTKTLCNAVEEGGLFVSEDLGSEQLEINSSDYDDALEEWMKGIKEQYRQQQSDITIGMKMPAILKKLGLSILSHSDNRVEISTREQKEFFVECTDAAYHILPENEHWKIKVVRERFETMSKDARIRLAFVNFTQVTAQKPALE